MKINQTTKYAIRSALYLARSGGTVCSAEIAHNTGIPQSYLLRVLSQGVKAGIFGVAQGVQGGFCIKRQPEDISMLDLLLMSQGKLEICKQEKAAYGGTPVSDDCPMLDHVCGGLQRVIEDYLSAITVKDLVDRAKAMQGDTRLCRVPVSDGDCVEIFIQSIGCDAPEALPALQNIK